MLFTCILLAQALPAIHYKCIPQQARSMSNHSTIKDIPVVWLIVEKQLEVCKDQLIYMTFVNFKAAFDSVDHHALWTILRTIGVPRKIITLFSELYDKTECCFWSNGKESRWFSVKTGVKQGHVVAPDLFNCIVHYLMTQVCQRITGIRLGNYHLTYMECGNDTTLFSDTVADLEASLNIFQEETSKPDFQVRWEKTQADTCQWQCRSIPNCHPVHHHWLCGLVQLP